MTEWQVFGVVVAMFGFVTTMYTMFYKPSHELKIEIVKLISELEFLNKDNAEQNKRLDKHEQLIDNNKTDIIHIKNQLFIKDRESH